MKRAQIVAPQKPLVISETSIPEPPSSGAVIKTSFSGICHSDLNQWNNEIDQGGWKMHFTDNPNYKFPITPGHEISGIVYSLGNNQRNAGDLVIGDQVVAYPWIGCGKCGFCADGITCLCKHRYHGLGIGAPSGGYSSYVVVPETKFLVKVPTTIPMHVACMLPCSGITTYNAVKTAKPAVENMTKYKGKASLLVIGSGGLGLWCLQIARQVLPEQTKIVVADINENSLKAAKERGYETVLWNREMSKKEAAAVATSKAHDGGYDCVIDIVNSTGTAERAFECTHRGALIVMVGLYGGAANISLPGIVHGVRTIKGVLVGTLSDLKELVQIVATNNLTPPPIRYFSLEDAYEGLCLVKDGKMGGRGIIKHS